MSQLLNNLMQVEGATTFHTPEFLSYIHTHEAYLKANSIKTPLDPGLVHKFEYNFMSLLVELKLPIENLLIFMVVNDLDCPTQMTRDFKEMRLPDLGVVDNLKNLYLQTPGRI
ncbi:hypothetical protein D3C73_209250 [compost metagenome]|jgi:hypothetical protein